MAGFYPSVIPLIEHTASITISGHMAISRAISGHALMYLGHFVFMACTYVNSMHYHKYEGYIRTTKSYNHDNNIHQVHVYEKTLCT